MKRCLPLLLFFTLALPVSSFAQDQDYYVTIGVFAIQDNAVRYTAKANKSGFSAQYAINPRRNLYYVYLLQSTDRRKAVSFMLKIRGESEYKDAWLPLRARERLANAGDLLVEQVFERPVIHTDILAIIRIMCNSFSFCRRK